ncbi:MAG: hypothetical protein WD810_04230 [Solirubrobacterales bacterium]
MFNRSLITALFALACLAVPAAASAAPSSGAVVFSKASTAGDVAKGGLYAVRDGRLNQLTEDPTDSEPAFSPDGRTIAFARGGDLFSVRPDGSGERRLTSGPGVDSAPLVSPSGRYVVFERRAAAGAPADLYIVGAMGGGLRALTKGVEDDSRAAFSPDGRAIAFVRNSAGPDGGNDDLYSIRPTGAGLARLTTTGGIDEFAPRHFAGGILYSRGESSEGPAAYADVYTMRRNGTRVKPQVAGVGSAYVEDVSSDGRTLLFRRDQGLWVKRIGPAKARKLCQLSDGSETNGVFSSDGRRVAAFVAVEEQQSLVSIDVANGRQTELAEGFDVSEGDGTLTRLDPASGDAVGKPLRLGAGISGVAVGAGSVWVSDPPDGEVLRIDPKTGTVVDRIDVGGRPGPIAFGGGRVWIADDDGAGISAIEAKGGRMVRRGLVTHAAPLRLGVGGGGLWVSSASTGTLRRIDLSTIRPGKAILVGRGPAGVTVAHGLVWVANSRAGTVSTVDSTTQVLVGAPIDVGGQPGGIDAGTSAVWVAAVADDAVTRIDLESGERIGAPIEVGPEPGAVAVGESAVWVVNNGDGTVTRIEP